MTIRYVNTGTSANKGDGDSLRYAFITINQNFSHFRDIINDSTNLVIQDQSIYGTQPGQNNSIFCVGIIL